MPHIRLGRPGVPAKVTIIASIVVAFLAAIGLTTSAVATEVTKPAVLASWTQPRDASYSAWDAARRDQAFWGQFDFDWTTDLCSASPDQPLGFDFRMPCWRHDFGYRNYKAIADFPANKARVDDAFRSDMTTVCSARRGLARKACLAVARTYYQAVASFGDLTVSAEEVERIGAEVAAEAAPDDPAPGVGVDTSR